MFSDAFVALLAPGDCRVCGDALLRAGDCPVCAGCLERLSGVSLPPGCARCSESLGFETQRSGDAQCAMCTAEAPEFVRAVAWGDYEDLRRMVHMMKFEHVPGLARPLGALLARAMLSLRAGAPDALVVVPVPLYRGKRAFNQSELLAQSALRMVKAIEPGWDLRLRPGMLKRVRNTERQYLLSPALRRANVRDAFVADERVVGQHVLLVDDVYTTGATAAECTRVLLLAGAASVRVSTVARAVREGAARWHPAAAGIPRDGPAQKVLPEPF